MGTEVLRPQNCLIEPVRVSRRNFYGYNCNYNNYNNNNSSSSSTSYNANFRFNRKPATRSDQRKRQPEHQQPFISKRSSSLDVSKISRNHANRSANNTPGNLLTDKVTILRRGESLDSKFKSTETTAAIRKGQPAGGLVVTGTDRLGPDPEMVPKQVRIVDLKSPVNGKCDMYAGSGFAVSPAPSSLPLPSFSKKKQVPVDDSATRDLRRLLRLDF